MKTGDLSFVDHARDTASKAWHAACYPWLAEVPLHANPLSSPLAPLGRFLAAPDAPSGEHPVEPAATLAVGMVGAGLFGGAASWALSSVSLGGGSDGDPLTLIPAFLLGVPLAQLLCFPPLYLWSTLRGVLVSPVRMASAATAGPGAMGAFLGATAPVFLLYGLAAPPHEEWSLAPLATGLLIVLTVLVSLFIGARNAVRAGENVGLRSPGALVRLAHYAVVLWTTAILVLYLSRQA